MALQDIQIWQLLAGLGLFLFGMFMLEEAIKLLAGRSFKLFLRKHTGNPIKAVIAGLLVTMVLQSSSMVSLLVMSFAGAGIIGLRNGIGMILGANLGTTATGWLVSLIGFKLNIESFIMPFLAIGGLGIIFLKSGKLSNLSKLLMGFSFMFLGLSYMKDGFASFAAHLDLSFLVGKSPLLFVGFGVLLAASIQSSSASMMIVLSSLSVGMLTIEQGAYMVIGGDLGTTITALFGTLRGNLIRRKVGYSQFYFNLLNGILAFLLLPILLWIIENTFGVTDPLIAVVLFHSMFNFMGIIVVLPFLGLFTRLLDKVILDKEIKHAVTLSQASAAEPFAATHALETETKEFLKKAVQANQSFFKTIANSNQYYIELKKYEDEMVQFYLKLMQNRLTQQEAKKVNLLVAAVRNATLSTKALKDIQHNITELRGAVTEPYFEWYKKIRVNQKSFYKAIREANGYSQNLDTQDIDRVKILQLNFYKHENDDLYRIINQSENTEFETPSLFNMITELNNSNESMIRAFRFLHQAVGIEIVE